METLTIKWQRLVHGGETCPRCCDTGAEVRKAADTLAAVVAPLGIKLVIEEIEMDVQEFKRHPLESNRILLDGRALEDWLSGATGQSLCCDVCGPNDCRTMIVDGRTRNDPQPGTCFFWPMASTFVDTSGGAKS